MLKNSYLHILLLGSLSLTELLYFLKCLQPLGGRCDGPWSTISLSPEQTEVKVKSTSRWAEGGRMYSLWAGPDPEDGQPTRD